MRTGFPFAGSLIPGMPLLIEGNKNIYNIECSCSEEAVKFRSLS
jgi:hypothetical protein